MTTTRKILFLFWYRSGSALWRFLSGKQFVNFHGKENGLVPLYNPEVSTQWVSTLSTNSFWLPTIPARTIPCEHIRIGRAEAFNAHGFPVISWYAYTGDWWGDKPSCQVPEPYGVNTPVKYGPADLEDLPGDNWTIASLIRDGRNQIESLRSLAGGVEQEKQITDPHDYFRVLCKGFRNRARMAIDCCNQLSNFKIFRFEDFMSNHIKCMTSMYDHLELRLDSEFVERAYELTVSSGARGRHSSFVLSKSLNQRWKSWTEQEIETFKQIAGKELIELGYEESNNWGIQ